MSYPWDEQPVFCFSSDIDWASEEVIKFSHDILLADNLYMTYFNTHPSHFMAELCAAGRARVLIHPNFLPDSSQGSSFQDVIEYCIALAPQADGFRSHRYFEVNDIMDEFAQRQFKFVSNHCTRCETNLRPLMHRSGMVSIPIFLEDGGYLLMDTTLDFNALKPLLEAPGLKVINFHPAHMAFNTPNFAYTRKIKDSVSRESWNNLSASEIQRLEYNGFGVRNTIQSITEFVYQRNYPVYSMHDIYETYVGMHEYKY